MTRPGALLIDIDGVLVVSWRPLPGATDALRRLRDAGFTLRFLTNTTSRTAHGIVAGLRAAGFEVVEDEIVTAAGATAAYLAHHRPGARCLLLNSGDLAADLPGVHLVGRDTDPREVDAVIVGGAGPEFTYDALNHALACLLAGAELLAVHRNTVWRTAAGMQLDAGAYVVGLEAAAGVVATVIGKPAPAMFEAALRATSCDATDAVMIGDDIDSDVRGAQALGIVGVVVRTGKFRPEQLDRGEPPDAVLDSFADLPAWLDAR